MTTETGRMIGVLYEKYSSETKGYFYSCLHDMKTAEDLTHDLFLRLFKIDIITAATAKGLIFTMASRMVIDHMRQKKHRNDLLRYYYVAHSDRTASRNVTEMLDTHEQDGLKTMTKRRAQIYWMYFHEGKSVNEISRLLKIEKRTVECHIYNSRQTMQRYFAQCDLA